MSWEPLLPVNLDGWPVVSKDASDDQPHRALSPVEEVGNYKPVHQEVWVPRRSLIPVECFQEGFLQRVASGRPFRRSRARQSWKVGEGRKTVFPDGKRARGLFSEVNQVNCGWW